LSKKFSVLITPLDWGLGHATRCIPIIDAFLAKDATVSIATSGGALELLKKEYPQVPFFELVSYRAEYATNHRLLTKLFFQSFKFFSAIKKEHLQIKEILRDHHFDLIISDNRFGCYSESIPSIFVTHQINFVFRPSMKWAERIINYWNRQRIKKFSHGWVPDLPDRHFSGDLSAPKGLPTSFVGILSRFHKSSPTNEVKYDLIVLISGPEPQRTIFEKLIREQITNLNKKVLLVKGQPEKGEIISSNGLIAEAGHLKASELKTAIESSEFIISRSGYSTIMDLAAMGRSKIIFVPTPGQPEQEYLATRLKATNQVYAMNQDEIDIGEAMVRCIKFNGLSLSSTNAMLLQKAMEKVI
jgi:uncharacterized protein (TIGR00661 family)